MPESLSRAIATTCWSLILGGVGLTVGCDSGPELGQVTGRVTMDGKPLDQIQINFMPDPVKQPEGDGRMSYAMTDENGNYKLEFMGEESQYGAVVGWHKVTLEDLAPENARNGKVPLPRTAPELIDPAKTTLEYEIAVGDQVIDIELGRK